MNKLIFLILSLCSSVVFTMSFGQYNPSLAGGHNTCVTAQDICFIREQIENFFDSEEECISTPVFFKFHLTGTASLGIGSSETGGGDIGILNYNQTNTAYTVYGPFEYSSQIWICDLISQGWPVAHSGTHVYGTSNHVISNLQEGYYVVKLNSTTCLATVSVEYGQHYGGYGVNYPFLDCKFKKADCEDCISSFSPQPGKYILSAWTKGESNPSNGKYENPTITVSFEGSSYTKTLETSGLIIDDWQRIDGVIEVPVGATEIKISLECAAGNCYFDDVRFVPIDGSMVSYVYDPRTLRLMAELDERNYATLYEYNEEGKLIRIKKETEKGIMTIQENREQLHKD